MISAIRRNILDLFTASHSLSMACKWIGNSCTHGPPRTWLTLPWRLNNEHLRVSEIKVSRAGAPAGSRTPRRNAAVLPRWWLGHVRTSICVIRLRVCSKRRESDVTEGNSALLSPTTFSVLCSLPLTHTSRLHTQSASVLSSCFHPLSLCGIKRVSALQLWIFKKYSKKNKKWGLYL